MKNELIREFKAPRVCLLGGTGFVGRAVATRLAREGFPLRVLTRNRERHRAELITLPQLELIEADVFDPGVLKRHLAGCQAVIHLIGILNEGWRDSNSFQRIHVGSVQTAADAACAAGVRHFIHLSALQADAARGPSYYLRSKGEAEARLIATTGLKYSILRPSVIFGPDDSFLNRFATLLKLSPVFPLACANAKFAPVYVGDVAEAVARILCVPQCYGTRYELCGPRTYSLLELVRYTAACAGLRRWILPLGANLSRLQAEICEFVPGKPFSRDNYRSTLVDSTCTGEDGLARLGIPPTALEAIAPFYLQPKDRLDQIRRKAGRH